MLKSVKQMLDELLVLAEIVSDDVTSREDAIVVEAEVIAELEELETDLSHLRVIMAKFVTLFAFEDPVFNFVESI